MENREKKRRGSALVFVFMLLILFAGLAMSMYEISHYSAGFSTAVVETKIVDYYAEGGLQYYSQQLIIADVKLGISSKASKITWLSSNFLNQKRPFGSEGGWFRLDEVKDPKVGEGEDILVKVSAGYPRYLQTAQAGLGGFVDTAYAQDSEVRAQYEAVLGPQVEGKGAIGMCAGALEAGSGSATVSAYGGRTGKVQYNASASSSNISGLTVDSSTTSLETTSCDIPGTQEYVNQQIANAYIYFNNHWSSTNGNGGHQHYYWGKIYDGGKAPKAGQAASGSKPAKAAEPAYTAGLDPATFVNLGSASGSFSATGPTACNAPGTNEEYGSATTYTSDMASQTVTSDSGNLHFKGQIFVDRDTIIGDRAGNTFTYAKFEEMVVIGSAVGTVSFLEKGSWKTTPGSDLYSDSGGAPGKNANKPVLWLGPGMYLFARGLQMNRNGAQLILDVTHGPVHLLFPAKMDFSVSDVSNGMGIVVYHDRNVGTKSWPDYSTKVDEGKRQTPLGPATPGDPMGRGQDGRKVAIFYMGPHAAFRTELNNNNAFLGAFAVGEYNGVTPAGVPLIPGDTTGGE